MSWHLIFENRQEAEQIIPLNKIVKIQIEGRQYCLANTVKGFIAFDKACPHMTEDLSKGTLNQVPEVVCPWHAYRFDLTSGEEHRNRCRSINVYRTKWEANRLLVLIEK